jgi:hypothetical protein
MVINGGGNDSGGSNLSQMFFGQGGQLLKYALSQQSFFQNSDSSIGSTPVITLPASPNQEHKEEQIEKKIKFHK